jgi:hypothetical protein
MQDREYCLQRAKETRDMAVLAEPALKGRLMEIAEHWEMMAGRTSSPNKPLTAMKSFKP